MSLKKFRKVLIANRGEIACRIINTLRQLSIESVAIYEAVEKNAKHVTLADNAYQLDQGFLAIDEIITIALKNDVDAIHPGYGFLSENAQFAKAVAAAGIVFIGPDSEIIHLMGDKVEARRLAQEAEVPLLKGGEIEVETSEKEILALARTIGFPLLIKAAAGGGGKGMSVVHEESMVVQEAIRIREEAQRMFHNGRLVIERFVENARHIEVQILGNTNGENFVISDRECSIQRNNQKIIEEAPAVILNEETRKKLHQSAVALANKVKYKNAGTMEYLFEESSAQFFFLEMNTRLQVEHTVTEMVSGLDLVKEQLEIAMGKITHYDDIQLDGHAIECRVCAEAPDYTFTPDSGKILFYQEPEGVRVDSGIEENADVLPMYDNMIAKVICHSNNREDCIVKTEVALQDFTIVGVETNIPFVLDILQSKEYVENNISTGLLRKETIAINTNPITPEIAAITLLSNKKQQTKLRDAKQLDFTIL